MNRQGMNYARYESSDRLRRTLEFLLDGKPHTTREIIAGADVCAVNSVIDELRENGFDVPCIKHSRPAIYQIPNVEAARKLSRCLLERRPLKVAA